MPLIASEVAALDTSERARRIERLASPDSDETLPQRYCYLMAARQRRRSIVEARASASGDGPQPSYSALTPLDQPLKQLNEHLFAEENKRRTEGVGAARAAVEGVREAAYAAKHDAKDMYGAHARQNQWIHNMDRLPTQPLVSSTGEIANDHTAGTPSGDAAR